MDADDIIRLESLQPAPRQRTRCYQLGPVYFVPHYRQAGVYVGPGGTEYDAAELVAAGARQRWLQLWPRN